MQEKISDERSLDQKEEISKDTETVNSKPKEQKIFPLKYVEKLRRESSRYRIELKELKETYKDFSPEDIKEYIKLKNDLEIREKERIKELSLKNEKKINDLIYFIAESFSAISPEQVATLLRSEIDIDDDGKAFLISEEDKSIKDFVKEFLANNLHLVRSKKKRGASTSSSSVNIFSIEQISNMTAEQYEKHRDRILKTISKKI